MTMSSNLRQKLGRSIYCFDPATEAGGTTYALSALTRRIRLLQKARRLFRHYQGTCRGRRLELVLNGANKSS